MIILVPYTILTQFNSDTIPSRRAPNGTSQDRCLRCGEKLVFLICSISTNDAVPKTPPMTPSILKSTNSALHARAKRASALDTKEVKEFASRVFVVGVTLRPPPPPQI